MNTPTASGQRLRVLCLSPFHTGSHQRFFEEWASRSRHAFTLVPLSGHHWKWRMRHSAITLAEQLRSRPHDRFDLVIATDMLPLAEFRGLAPRSIADLPTVLYAHENQLTYPTRKSEVRDQHFAFTNFTSMCAADAVWFNSAFHRREWLTACEAWLGKMPDHAPLEQLTAIAEKSEVQSPGIRSIPPLPDRSPGPLRILWAARWEHDKNPETFFAAIDLLSASNVDFELHVIGEQFREVPDCFEQARQRHRDHLRVWGYRNSRAEYESVLQQSDVIVSTAHHEFCGLSVLEAVSAGCVPWLPNRLAYADIFATLPHLLHDGTAAAIASGLRDWCVDVREGRFDPVRIMNGHQPASPFDWRARCPLLDDALATQAMSS